MTIHEPARSGVNADRRSESDTAESDTATLGAPQHAAPGGQASGALVDRLNAGEPYAIAFGGQGDSSWLAGLEEVVTSAGIESELSRIAGEADLLLEPVAGDLVVVRPIGFQP